MRLSECEFCEKNEILRMWILWKKWDFQNVNFEKNETLKMWILAEKRLWKCEFCDNWDVF